VPLMDDPNFPDPPPLPPEREPDEAESPDPGEMPELPPEESTPDEELAIDQDSPSPLDVAPPPPDVAESAPMDELPPLLEAQPEDAGLLMEESVAAEGGAPVDQDPMDATPPEAGIDLSEGEPWRDTLGGPRVQSDDGKGEPPDVGRLMEDTDQQPIDDSPHKQGESPDTAQLLNEVLAKLELIEARAERIELKVQSLIDRPAGKQVIVE
jgi:hypothetical protein